jgi:uncharacterized RDD family membrane protein YckC
MKCPKCSYIGFETSDRCRNCGYDFSLSAAAATAAQEPDLSMRVSEPMGPMSDFDLEKTGRAPRATPQPRGARRRLDAPSEDGGSGAPADLPLFGELPPDDAPLVRAAPTPTAPLSVRRSTPAPTRPRSPLTRRPEREADPLPLDTAVAVVSAKEPDFGASQPGLDTLATIGARAAAAALDGALLLGLDVVVLYFTLRVCRLPAAELPLLPLLPLAGFMLLLNGGYLALFTAASGQTLGKMAFGLKVVPAGEHGLTVGRSLLRVLAFLVGGAAAGLGLLPALFDASRRGLHDRLANTRVVRAS